MQIRKVGVVGCGLMGHGIVQVAAQGGFDVVALETTQDFLDKGLARIEKSLAKMAEKEVEKKKTTPEAAKKAADAARARIQGSLATKDLDGLFETLQATDAEVVQEPTDQPWGARDCAFRDPSGNTIRIDEVR